MTTLLNRLNHLNITLTAGVNRRTLRQPAVVLAMIWILAMISVPIARWTVGDHVIPVMAVVTTGLQCATVVSILQLQWTVRRTLSVFLIVAVLTYLAEYLGSTTGLPFGSYDYTPLLQPQLAGVPVIIPLAWLMMLAPAWAVAAAILPRGDHSTTGHRVSFALISALAITAWDLFLDPQMVGWDFWVWAEPSGYFGIPWSNYAGWLLTATVVTFVVSWVAPLAEVPVRLLLVIYGIVWILQTIGLAVFWGQPGPALFGFLAMGLMLALAVYRLRQHPTAQRPELAGVPA